MNRSTLSFSTLLLLVTVTGAIGCATAGSGEHRDVHASATLGGAGPKMLVAGPATLVHVDLDGRNELALYTVARKLGNDADCGFAPVGGQVRLRSGRSNHVNLAITENQAICVTPAAVHASITWHATKTDGSAASTSGTTLAMRTQDR